MKKQHVSMAVAALLLAAAGSAQAQSDRKGFVGIGVGASIPTGDFADSDENNKDAGRAKTGLLLDLQLGYKFTDVVGAMVLVRSQGHPYDEETGVASGNTLEADPYATLSFMAGPLVSFPLDDYNTIAFESRGLVGYSQTRSPELSVNGTRVLESERGSSFAWLVGTGVKFNVSESFGLGLHVDYFSAKPEFEFETLAGKATESQTINAVNASLSLGFRF